LSWLSWQVGDSSNAKLSGVGAIADDWNISQMRRQASKQASNIGAIMIPINS
jgi:hypothetical protein